MCPGEERGARQLLWVKVRGFLYLEGPSKWSLPISQEFKWTGQGPGREGSPAPGHHTPAVPISTATFLMGPLSGLPPPYSSAPLIPNSRKQNEV